MTDVTPLFQPFTLKGVTLKNRIAMAPMTRQKSPGGVPNDSNVAYYQRRAAAEVGLIITEGTVTRRPASSPYTDVPNFYTPEALNGWKRIADAVHEAGGKIAPQIWHLGAARKPGQGPFPDAPSDSPSGLSLTGKKFGDEPTDEDVLDMAEAYAESAAAAKRLGFDMIELHGAHAYLIDQFLWEVTNQRTDRWGGSIEKRAEFAAEVIRRCRKAVGDLPIIIRISQWKSSDYTARLARTPQELERLLKVLVDAGVDCIHCSQRRIWEPEFPEIDGEKGLNFAGWTKKLTGLPTISVGSVGLSSEFTASFRGEGSAKGKLDEAVDRLAKGEFDLVAVGRALMQDPEWAKKVKEGRYEETADYDGASKDVYY